MLASLTRLDAPLLAGAMAGLASCVKNEGLLFVSALTVTLLFVKRSVLPRFLIGAAPALIAVLFFKAFSPSNDILGSLSMTVLRERLTNPARYGQILTILAGESLNVLLWGAGTLPILALYLAFAGARTCDGQGSHVRVVLLTLALMMLGFITIYLITPWDLARHLGTSADRLILQLWPSTLFLFFVLARTPKAMSPRSK
jgi:hypothetical protein